MDFVDILFNKNRPFVPIKISGGTTNGRVVSGCKQHTFGQNLEPSEREMFEDDIHETRLKLNDTIKTSMKIGNDYDSNALDGHDDDIDVYKKYKFDRRSQSATQLPIYGSKDKIMSKIRQVG